MSTARTIVKNVFSLFAASVFGKLITLVVLAYAARVLQVERFGQWSFGLTVAGYFGVLANLGLDGFGALELARHRDRLEALVGQILPLKLIGSILGMTLAGVVALLLPKGTETRILVFLCYLPMAMGFWNLVWVFIGIERLEYMAIGQILEQVVNAGMVLLLVSAPDDLLWMPVAATIGVAASSLCMLVWFFRRLGRIRFRPSLTGARTMLMQSLPFGLTGVLSQVYFNFDTVMLSFLRSDAEVGWYNAAYKLLAPLIAFRFSIIYSLNPRFSRRFVEAPQEIAKDANRVLRVCLYAALPVGVGGMIVAEPLVRLVFGEAYAMAAQALMLLVWSVACLFLNIICLIVLYAVGRQGTVLKVTLAAVALNLLLNWFLIPLWGIGGAAAATVATDALSLGVMMWLTRAHVSIRLWEVLPRPAGCAMVMGMILWWFRDLNVLISIPLGAAIYGAGLFATGAVKWSELATLRQMMTGKS